MKKPTLITEYFLFVIYFNFALFGSFKNCEIILNITYGMHKASAKSIHPVCFCFPISFYKIFLNFLKI